MSCKIKRDCFWYRPWRDMGAMFDQCELAEPTECPCSENCKSYITKKDADAFVKDALNRQKNY